MLTSVCIASGALLGALTFLGDWRLPSPSGKFSVGSLRGRLPQSNGAACPGLLAQVHYPADLGATLPQVGTFEYCRPEICRRVAKGYSIPDGLLRWLVEGKPQVDPPGIPYAPAGRKWPLIIFQTGLWGSFEFYTQFCRELASTGAIVITLEHEDGTSIMAEDRRTGQTIEYREQPPYPYDMVDYNEDFLQQRALDLREAISTVRELVQAAGQGVETAHCAMSAVLRYASLDDLIVAGHSFGACSVVHCLKQAPPELATCRGALLLDFWPGPLTDDVSGAFCEELGASLPVPYALILSDMWVNSEWYGASCRRLACPPRCLGACVVPGANHYWIADVQWWAPEWLLRLLQVMGPGQRDTAHVATCRCLGASLRALLGGGPPEAAADPAWLRAEMSAAGLIAI